MKDGPFTVTEVAVIQRLFGFGLPKQLIALALERPVNSINGVLTRHGRPRAAYRFTALDLHIIGELPETPRNIATSLDKPERSISFALSRMHRAGVVRPATNRAEKGLEVWKKQSRVAPTPLDLRVLHALPATLPDLSAQTGVAISSVWRSLKRLQGWDAVTQTDQRRCSDTAGEQHGKFTVVWDRGAVRLSPIDLAVVQALPGAPATIATAIGQKLDGVLRSLQRLKQVGIADTDQHLCRPGPRATVWEVNLERSGKE